MKHFIIALFFVSLAGCMKQYTDTRPADQARFISITREWRDTVNAAGTNEALRYQLLENGTSTVKTHIRDSLQLEFQSWEARVLDVASDPSSHGNMVASFGMNLDAGNMTEKTRYNSVVFTSSTEESEPAYETIKTLKVGDIVRISGNFKTLQKTIDIDSYSKFSRSKNVLDNPELRVEIVKVEKL